MSCHRSLTIGHIVIEGTDFLTWFATNILALVGGRLVYKCQTSSIPTQVHTEVSDNLATIVSSRVAVM